MDIFTFLSQQWVLISLLLALIYMFVWSERTKGGKPMPTTELVTRLNTDQAVLIDVRPSNEFQAGHICGAISIPHAKVDSRISELAKHRSKMIVLTDQMGQHAGGVGRKLTKQGYQVRRLSGGMAEWQGQNLPVVKD